MTHEIGKTRNYVSGRFTCHYKRSLSATRAPLSDPPPLTNKKIKHAITDRCLLCEAGTNNLNSICCAICSLRNHDSCCGLSDVIKLADRSVIISIGWVCPTCRGGAKSALDKLRADLSALTMLVSSLQPRLEASEKNVSD